MNQLVACWLATIGSAICAPANAETMEKTQQSLVLDSKKESDFPIEIKAAGDAILGEPIRLPLSFPKGEVPIQIAIEQRELEGHNHCDAQTVPVEMKSGDYPFITFVPCGLGETRLQIMSVSSDRTRIGLGNITLFIRPPKAAPITFKADRFSQTYIDLDKNEPFAVVDAVATFAGIPGKFSVPHEFLDFSIEQSSPPGAITVTKLGLLQGIKEGVATLTVRFGTVGDTVKVFARHRSTDDPFQVKP